MKPGTRSRPLAGWAPHLALLALAAAQVALFAALHLPDERAWRIATDPGADTDARIGALHRVASRATTRDPRLGTTLTAELLAADDARLREFALTVDLCKHHAGAARGDAPPLQAAYALRHPGTPGTAHHLRSVLVYRRKVGGEPVGGMWRLTWDEVQWFVDSLAGRPLPEPRTLAAHFEARAREGDEVMRRRRMQDDEDR